MIKSISIILLAVVLNGCSIVDGWTYKLNKQQGNVTEQKHIDKLEMGMSKEQVRFLLGTPMSVDSFDHDRWDYVYTYQAGHEEATQNNLTVYFEDNKLNKIEGEALIQPDKLKSNTPDEEENDTDIDGLDDRNE